MATVSEKQVQDLYVKFALNPNVVPVDTFHQGLNVELEHGSNIPISNVTDDNLTLVGKIAVAHLIEDPYYYQRLEKMEEEGEEYWEQKQKPSIFHHQFNPPCLLKYRFTRSLGTRPSLEEGESILTSIKKLSRLVYLGHNIITDAKVIITMDKNSDKMEYDLLRNADRTHDILELLDDHYPGEFPKSLGYFKDKYKGHDMVVQVFDYLPGIDLIDFANDLYHQGDSIDSALFWELAYDMAQSIKKVHQLNIVHRDIKPENFLKSNDRLNLIDFEFACSHDDSNLLRCNFDKIMGSRNYLAPELRDHQVWNQIKGSSDILKKSDIWSYGASLYLLWNRKYPYPEYISPADLKDHEIVYDDRDEGIDLFLADILRYSPHMRPNIDQVIGNIPYH